jgi:hypothetical protein
MERKTEYGMPPPGGKAGAKPRVGKRRSRRPTLLHREVEGPSSPALEE